MPLDFPTLINWTNQFRIGLNNILFDQSLLHKYDIKEVGSEVNLSNLRAVG